MLVLVLMLVRGAQRLIGLNRQKAEEWCEYISLFVPFYYYYLPPGNCTRTCF